MLKKSVPLLFLGIGVFLLVQIILPLISFKIWEISITNQNSPLISPNPENQNVAGISIQNQENFPALVSTNIRTSPAPYSEFTVSIPSLKLENLKAKVDTNIFEQNLAHLPGSALPGEKGNVFITGHSSLPQLFSPSNFKAIFANLPNIKKGDQIIIDAGGQKFEYIVDGLKIVNPKEIWVINPPDNQGRYLSLMTCVPPGLYLKRLIVLASLK